MAVSVGLNGALRFGAGRAENAALESGWSTPESGQVWSDGGTAVLSLKLAFVASQADRLVIHASPKLPSGSPYLAVGVFGNGLLIGWCQLDATGAAELRIPRAVKNSTLIAGELELSFAIPHHAPGNEEDRRRLGLALHSIELRAAV